MSVFGKCRKLCTHALLKPAAHFVSHNCSADLFADRKADSYPARSARQNPEGDITPPKGLTFCIDQAEFSVFLQRVHIKLCGELLSALCASALEDVAAVLGCHSFSEAVNLASLSLFGLVSLFHN